MSNEDLEFIGPEICPYCSQKTSIVEEMSETLMERGEYKGKTVTTPVRYYRCDTGCLDEYGTPFGWVDGELYQLNFDRMMEELKKKYG